MSMTIKWEYLLIFSGMGGCLSVASNAAKTLAAALNKPLVGVHHMVLPFTRLPLLD